MKLDEIIKERHSCRTFLPTAISDEQIKTIVEAARFAPSAKNIQPWKFVCIKTAEESHDIANIMENYYLINKNHPKKMVGAGSVFATGKTLESCPAIILVFSDSERITRNKVEDISSILSVGAAVEHMMLKATDMGLGSLWICDTYFVHNELADYVLEKLKGTESADFISKNNRLLCAMAVGEMGEQAHPRPRKTQEEILRIINN